MYIYYIDKMVYKTEEEYKAWYDGHYKKVKENSIVCEICGKLFNTYTKYNHYKSKHHKNMEEINKLKSIISLIQN
jgi:hypothetical protein